SLPQGLRPPPGGIRRVTEVPGVTGRRERAAVEWFTASEYWLGRLVFQRALAGLYLVALLPAALQFRALIGERGMLPVPRFVERVPFRRSPSLFHLHYSDRFFAGCAWAGCAVSAALI